ncbi:FAD/NAD-P-binding domain-containing protein [Thelephora ganbajun]|uniref:FAD/NAD-P-binding domain-containing protein n=1 Tax=Thelephora ganbajun TaxID=370292 RepID=A0ACB6ZX61_THEGA|nr:FAD/NAD-P-binding domain-containing protein [Thelephora ganbajun]
MSAPTPAKNVVVLGGGGAGATVAQTLSKKLNHAQYNLILVDMRPHMIWLPACARMVVTHDEAFTDTAVFPYENVFPQGKGTFKLGKVVAINEAKDQRGGQLAFDNGETLNYEVLAVCIGSHWPGPLNLPNSKDELNKFVGEWRSKFKEAKDILLVGAGAVGLELAGELRDEYPTKKITIVHSQTLILNQTYPVKFRKMVGTQFRARNIEFILNDVVESFPESDSGEVGLKSGQKVHADLIVRTSGPRPNTEFLESSLGSDILTEEKFVRVSPQLQVFSHPSVFVAGDIVDWPEEKQFGKTVGQAAVVAENIISYLTDRPLKKKYTGSPEAIVLTNGKVRASASFCITVSDCLQRH